MTTPVTHCVVWYVVLCCCTHTHHPNVPGTCVDWDSCCTAPTRTHAGASCLAQCGPVPLLRSSPEPPDPGPPSAAAEAPSLETLPVLSVDRTRLSYTRWAVIWRRLNVTRSPLSHDHDLIMQQSWFLSTSTSETPRSSLVSMIFIERDSASLQRELLQTDTWLIIYSDQSQVAHLHCHYLPSCWHSCEVTHWPIDLASNHSR